MRRQAVNSLFRTTGSLLPERAKRDMLGSKLSRSDRSLHLDCTLLVLQKVAEDKRPYDWFVDF